MKPIGKSSSFLRWIIALSMMVGASCNQKEPPSSIIAELSKLTKFRLAPKTKAVVIVADNSCTECNRRLSSTMTGYLNRQDVQFVISAHESAIDLSQYQKAARKDIVFDYNHRLTDNEVIKGSMVVLMKGEQVDTVLEVNAAGIADQFAS